MVRGPGGSSPWGPCGQGSRVTTGPVKGRLLSAGPAHPLGGAVSDEGTCQEADVPGEEDLHRHSGLGAGLGDPSLPTADPGLPAMPLGSPRSMLALLM